MDKAEPLMRGRRAFERRAWNEAYESLALADQGIPLTGEDLERLAVAAFLTDREADFLRALERAHQHYLDAGAVARAARCGFWIGLLLALRGETGPATGWLKRAQRLLDRDQLDCVERGYLLMMTAEQHLEAGDIETAERIAAQAVAIGDCFREPDLIASARHLQGRALIQQGLVEAGLGLLDEAMVSVTSGELSPLMTGLVYCSVIETCQRVHALGRAQEWTTALARWCDDQQELVAFTGTCLVHRAEVLQMHGSWPDALAEARRACERFSRGIDERPPAAALYRQGEVHRLRGEFEEAEDAYHGASRWGYEPQPGLALLRLSQGRADAAAAALRRALATTTDPLDRTKLLPAYVEVMLAACEVEEARAACLEIEETSRAFQTQPLEAIGAQARGKVELAEGKAENALSSLRRAWQIWDRIDAPYLAAQTRVLIGLACRELGDDEGCELELNAARAVFKRLHAAPDFDRVGSLLGAASPVRPEGLTAREVEVLRLVAAGKSNRLIATELCISEKTVARHLSNIFRKLDLPNRASATAYAYEHELV